MLKAVCLLGLLLAATVPSSAQLVVDQDEQLLPGFSDNLQVQSCSIFSRFYKTLRAFLLVLAPQAGTVAELAEHAPSNMSILVNALNRVDLHQTIADPNFSGTIFAPTNKAFRVALLKLKLTPEQLYADKTALTNILSYHVVGGQALAAGDLKDGQQLTTVSQQPLTVHVDKVAGTSIQGGEDTAKVLAVDIKAGKAIIHVIDTVLLPPKPSKTEL
eukprot:gene13542-13668_t